MLSDFAAAAVYQRKPIARIIRMQNRHSEKWMSLENSRIEQEARD
jgi:hypothetical protein